MTSTALLESTRDTLERAITRIDEYGWLNNSGKGDNGERCLLNTIGFVKPLRHTNGAWADVIYDAMAQVITDQMPDLSSESGIISLIIDFNDNYCKGTGHARQILEGTLKNIIGKLEACAPAPGPVGS